MDDTLPLRRSVLFVPGAEPRKIDRARQAGADTVLFDLEDAVAPDHKERARQHVVQAVQEGGFGSAELAVRVNAWKTPYFDADVEVMLGAGIRTLMLPKCDHAERVAQVGECLAALEGTLGIPADETVTLLALVESAAGVAHAVAVGGEARVTALCFGHADFALDMGLAEADPSSGVIYHARCAVALAAKASGVAPLDNVCLTVQDAAAFRADALMGLRLGFEGKLCIHPSQITMTNEIYTPTTTQIAYARRVVEGWGQAQASGRGVFVLDNKMVDAPLVALQRRVLERARRAGVLSE